ncbi:MAG: GNAT family N-acetyltransferase [Myxococcota bacterium]|nr:GNAT family N-acetyltransferase [Myxococcota bacterium]
MEIVLISPTHPLHPAEVDLRFRVLRAPLGIRREEVRYPLDEGSLHWVGVEEERVVGCVLFHPETAQRGRLLQMAVEPALQGRGMGRQLVRALEAEAASRGFEEVTLHAREEKVGFYLRLGYELYGDPFVEVGIPHRLMRRRL